MSKPDTREQLCLSCGKECDIQKTGLVHVEGWYHEGCDPRAEIERLKEALRRIRKCRIGEPWDMLAIAAEALADKEEK